MLTALQMPARFAWRETNLIANVVIAFAQAIDPAETQTSSTDLGHVTVMLGMPEPFYLRKRLRELLCPPGVFRYYNVFVNKVNGGE